MPLPVIGIHEQFYFFLRELKNVYYLAKHRDGKNVPVSLSGIVGELIRLLAYSDKLEVTDTEVRIKRDKYPFFDTLKEMLTIAKEHAPNFRKKLHEYFL